MKNFNLKLDYENYTNQTNALFAIFWLISISVTSITLYINWNLRIDQFLYIVKVTILTHVSNIESFQIFVFTNGVRRRLQVSAKHVKSNISIHLRGSTLVRDTLLELYDINKSINCWFEVPLMFIVAQNYTSLLTYSYWTFASFVGFSWSYGVPIGEKKGIFHRKT